MTIPCLAEDKNLVIRLTEDILIDSLSIINREFYSSSFKNFAVYGNI
jgi:hypothetical protein